MKKLLERWAELAPGECERGKQPNTRSDCGPCFDVVLPEGAGMNICSTHTGPITLSFILYAVLMCCEGRGWFLSRHRNINDDMFWEIDTGEILRYSELDIRCDSPAEAALAAYIKALEATQ